MMRCIKPATARDVLRSGLSRGREVWLGGGTQRGPSSQLRAINTLSSHRVYAASRISSIKAPSWRYFSSGITEACKEVQFGRSSRDICVAIADLQYSNGPEEEVQLMIPLIVESLNECKDEFPLEDIADAMFGLQILDSKHADNLHLLTSLHQKLIAHNKARWSVAQISKIMFGLQGMSSEHEEVKEVVILIQEQLRRCSDAMTIEAFSDIVCGLHSMDSEHVLDFISVLVEKSVTLEEFCDGPQLELIFHGMNHMDSDFEPVKRLIQLANNQLVNYGELIGDDGIADGLMSLRLMDSNSKEALSFVRGLNALISRKIDALQIPVAIPSVDVMEIITSLYGFQSSHPEVQELLVHVHAIIETNLKLEEVESDAILEILEMFGSFTDEPQVVRALLVCVKDKISALENLYLDTAEMNELLGDCFRNFNFQDCSEVRDLISLLQYKAVDTVAMIEKRKKRQEAELKESDDFFYGVQM